MTGRKADATAAPHQWRKSSYSPDNGNGQACVEIASGSTGVFTRDSKLGAASPLIPLNSADYAALLNHLK